MVEKSCYYRIIFGEYCSGNSRIATTILIEFAPYGRILLFDSSTVEHQDERVLLAINRANGQEWNGREGKQRNKLLLLL